MTLNELQRLAEGASGDDSRQAFERAMWNIHTWTPELLRRGSEGQYVHICTQFAWVGWQAFIDVNSDTAEKLIAVARAAEAALPTLEYAGPSWHENRAEVAAALRNALEELK